MGTESSIITRDSQTGDICKKCGCSTAPFRIEIAGIEKYVPKICKCEAQAIREQEYQNQVDAKQRRLDVLFKQSRLGERFKDCTFDNYPRIPETDGIFMSLYEFADNFSKYVNKSILMVSHPGTGKTYLSSCVVNKLVLKGITAIFVVVPDLLNQIRSTYDRSSSEKEDKIMFGLCETELLVLDDIGAERHRDKEDWGTEKLYSIINSRYNNMKATIFTTNCTMKELAEKLGDRTYSRICEMTEGFRYNLDNVMDFRMKSFYKK
jgi:DNA replication protein DnaC